MEFLSPEEKRYRTFRFIIGYFLIAIAVLLASFIAILLVQGYQLSNRQGVVQNGLVNVESRPVSADISINNKLAGRTSARFDMNEGDYYMRLKATNYREWSKNFSLAGGSVRYFTYPKLIPDNISTLNTVEYNGTPLWASESLDRHWIISKTASPQPEFNVFDTTRVKSTQATNQNIILPNNVASPIGSSYGSFEAIEWADDNKHILLLQTLPDGNKSYIILDREKPENSINISKTLTLEQSQKVTLRDRKSTKFYVLNTSSGQLIKRDSKDLAFNIIVANGVVTYKSYGDDLVMYVTYASAPDGYARVLVSNKINDIYNLQSVVRDSTGLYQLDIAKFDGTWYYATSSSSEKRVKVYANPLIGVAPNTNYDSVIRPKLSLPLANPMFVSFSDNARFISAQSGSNFVVYDGELKTSYRYTIKQSLAKDQKALWMDGHRMKIVAESKSFIFEFDGTNSQELIPSLPNNSFSPYFDRDYNYVFTYQAGQVGKAILQAGSLVVQNN